MSTSEHRAVDAESDLPLGAAELAALASQLYAASIRPGPDSPPQSAPVAPRGSVPDTTAAASAGQTAAGSSDLYSSPLPLIGISDIYVPAPTSPEPEPPPQAVPVEDGKTKFILVRTGEERQGVVGLFQPGLVGEQAPGLSVRFTGINQQAAGQYALVGGGYVRVGSDYRGNPYIEVPPEGDFL